MAMSALLITLIVAAAAAPALATTHIVGDDAGWKLGVNYTAWAAGKDIHVGDSISFIYNPAVHSVLTVNGTDFKACLSSNNTANPLNAKGNHTVSFIGPGRHWYVCDVADHCLKGMKVLIVVSAAEGPIPPPVPGTSAAAGLVLPSKSWLWILAVAAAAGRMIAA